MVHDLNLSHGIGNLAIVRTEIRSGTGIFVSKVDQRIGRVTLNNPGGGIVESTFCNTGKTVGT
ncbi:MAG: hypothetical protein DKT66_08315 [Candidatus Melainabacteria bacterium]|nr:MAG: hypothetical protein DKT66_08315 [Candidatus Melainabacteria bacterium]